MLLLFVCLYAVMRNDTVYLHYTVCFRLSFEFAIIRVIVGQTYTGQVSNVAYVKLHRFNMFDRIHFSNENKLVYRVISLILVSLYISKLY